MKFTILLEKILEKNYFIFIDMITINTVKIKKQKNFLK